MDIDLLHYISEYFEKSNFFGDQKKLDAMYYLLQGLSYRQVAEKIDKQISYVQRVMDYMKDNNLLFWGRWAPNVYKIGMKKSIAFLDWEDRELPKEQNLVYTTYIQHVQAEGPKVLVIYTYPKEDESRIRGEIGEMITPFYYTHTRFTTPFLKRTNLFKEFFDKFESVKNDKGILSGTPSFEAKKIYNDPLTVYICRYAELLPELAPGILTEKLEKDFQGREIEITYEKIRSTLSKMKKEEVIFPKNALILKPLSYQAALVRIETGEIYKVMETFNKFNMLTRLALTPDRDIFFLYIQYPFHQFAETMEILSQIDPNHKAYIETEWVMGDTIWYQWSLKRYKSK